MKIRGNLFEEVGIGTGIHQVHQLGLLKFHLYFVFIVSPGTENQMAN
jgi:hypothetical protein